MNTKYIIGNEKEYWKGDKKKKEEKKLWILLVQNPAGETYTANTKIVTVKILGMSEQPIKLEKPVIQKNNRKKDYTVWIINCRI